MFSNVDSFSEFLEKAKKFNLPIGILIPLSNWMSLLGCTKVSNHLSLDFLLTTILFFLGTELLFSCNRLQLRQSGSKYSLALHSKSKHNSQMKIEFSVADGWVLYYKK
jgi:hypothetical protein